MSLFIERNAQELRFHRHQHSVQVVEGRDGVVFRCHGAGTMCQIHGISSCASIGTETRPGFSEMFETSCFVTTETLLDNSFHRLRNARGNTSSRVKSVVGLIGSSHHHQVGMVAFSLEKKFPSSVPEKMLTQDMGLVPRSLNEPVIAGAPTKMVPFKSRDINLSKPTIGREQKEEFRVGRVVAA